MAETKAAQVTIQDDDVSEKKENLWIRLMTAVRWYPQGMPGDEKRLILKLDLSILVFGCLSFFTKYLDKQSLTNAYVRYVFSEAVSILRAIVDTTAAA
jgi:hypothetical protein